MESPSLADILTAEMERAGYNDLSLATAAGLRPDVIRDVKRGKTRQPSADKMLAISKVLGRTVEELLGKTPMQAASVPAEQPPQANVRYAPNAPALPPFATLTRDLKVWGSAEGGPDGYFQVQGLSPTDFTDLIRRPPGLVGVKQGFAMYVVGQSMVPWREPGELVYINAGRQPSPGCYVVAVLASSDGTDDGYHRAMVKRLVRRSATFVEFEQFNPPKVFRLPAAEVVKLYRVMTNDEVMGNG